MSTTSRTSWHSSPPITSLLRNSSVVLLGLSSLLIQAGCDIILQLHHSHLVSTGRQQFPMVALLPRNNVHTLPTQRCSLVTTSHASSDVHLTGLINAGCDNTTALQHPTLTASSSASTPVTQNPPPTTHMPCPSLDDFSWPLAKDRVARWLFYISLPMSFTASQACSPPKKVTGYKYR
jgi:hypothetical protein